MSSTFYGLPSLTAKDREKVREANLLMKRTAEIATTCILNQVPFCVENPFHSMVWLTNELKRLAGLPGVRSHRVDFCQYGEAYHKKTKLLYYGFELSTVAAICKGK